jgi:hypothetical protein
MLQGEGEEGEAKPQQQPKPTKNQRRKEQRMKKKAQLQQGSSPGGVVAEGEKEEVQVAAKVDPSTLSVKELRALLEKHSIDYKGAIEKEDMVERAKKHNL